jgi:pseudaminic acid biosynthesis-associated methylase
MQKQLDTWKGKFGDAYTERNVDDWRRFEPAFRTMLDGLGVQRVLEVGCNRGLNLITLAHVLGPESDIVGLEPNQHAVETARQASSSYAVLKGDAYDIPFQAGWFDLVFTVGVLIHIPDDGLRRAMEEIGRVSRHYILAAEYFSEQDTSVPYRGHDNLLFKRDFCRHYQENLPGLQLVRNGYWGPEDGFDHTHWWLLAKP